MVIDPGSEQSAIVIYDYEFTILGSPKAQGRPRTRVIQPKSGSKAFATIYETKEDKAAKEHIRMSVAPFAPDELLDGPLRVDVFFYLKRPMNHYGTGKNSGVLKERFAEIHHISKPDRDNLDKLVLDALTGVVWTDDSRICQGWVEKQYGEAPCVIVCVKNLSGGE